MDSMSETGNGVVIDHNALIDLIRTTTAEGAPISFRARGSSMLPFIEDNDLLTVSPADPTALRRGDILAFVDPQTGGLAVHRYIGKAGDDFIMKGDNRYGTDGHVPVGCLLGRVTCVKRGGKAANFSLGPARYPIALLSGAGFLVRLVSLARLFCRL